MKINVFCWDRSVCTYPYINIIMIQAFSTTPEAYLNPQTLPLTGVKVTWNNEASGLECQLSNQILITSQRSRLWPLFKFSLNLTTRHRGAAFNRRWKFSNSFQSALSSSASSRGPRPTRSGRSISSTTGGTESSSRSLPTNRFATSFNTSCTKIFT